MKSRIIQCASEKNPQSALLEQLQGSNVTINDLKWIITKTLGGPGTLSPIHPQFEVLNDLNNLKIDQPNCSEESILCKYVYFATALPHLWGRWMNDRIFSVFIKSQIISFVGPNKCVPYIWVHVHLHLDGKIAMVQNHCLETLRIETVVFVQDNLPPERLRMLYEPQQNEYIVSSKGVFLQIVVKLSDGTAHIPTSGVLTTAKTNFMIVLTSGKYYLLQHVYYNDSPKKKIFELLSVCHEEDSKE